MQIFFTGHKGFNIEVRPQALGITSTRNRQQEFQQRLQEIKRNFGSSFVDRLHEHVRLHNSINSWISINGEITHRIKVELTPDALNSMGIQEICLMSEKLASNILRENQRAAKPLFPKPPSPLSKGGGLRGRVSKQSQVTLSFSLCAIIWAYRRLKQGY